MLDYNQPIDRARPEAAQQRSQPGFNVLELVSLLWRHKIAIASAALIGASLAVTIGKGLTPRYTATAQLYVDPRELQLVDRELTLRARLRNAETSLATYKAQNNFVGTQDALISDQQLSASNQRLSAARAATMDAQARLDQIEANKRTAADAGAIPEALQSPTIANLRAQYADARKKYAEQTAELGPRHPALRQTEKQVEDRQRTIS